MASSVIESDELVENVCCVCVKKGKLTESDFYCMNCSNYYCTACLDVHAMIPATDGHNILGKRDFKSTSRPNLGSLPTLPTKRCEFHPSKVLDIYCVDHDQVLCSTCLLEHRSCGSVKSVPENITTLYTRPKLKVTKQNLKSQKSNLEEKKKSKVQKITDFKTSLDKAEGEVHEFSKNLHKIIDEAKCETISLMKKEFSKRETSLLADINGIERLLNSINKTLSELDRTHGNKSQEFVCIKTCEKLSAQIQETESRQEMQSAAEAITFTADRNIEAYLKQLQTLGNITTALTSAKAKTNTPVLRKYGGALPVREEALNESTFVAAIYFGITYSGYAFQSRDAFLSDPLSVRTNVPEATNRGFSRKIPSCILFDKHEKFYAFGSAAEAKYYEAVAEGKHYSWHFFRRFKMTLYQTQELRRTTMLKDDNDREMPAMTVFSASIRYLKDKLLKTLDQGVNPGDIHWVITIPSICSESCKIFMREAAINAGIHTDKLSLSLEPEAASLYCRYQEVRMVKGADSAEIRSLRVGAKYMIIDAGSDTVDITVHEILKDDTLRELLKANSGEWGGSKVDDKFEEFLNDVFGVDVMKAVMQEYREDLNDLMQTFKLRKQTITPYLTDPIAVRIPASIIEKYKELNGVMPLIPEKYRQTVTFQKDKMRIDSETANGFFTEVCDQICGIANEYFQTVQDQNIDKILMVGGFSESPMLHDKVRKTFPTCRIVIPEEAGLAVLKGAVLFGHHPKMIVARVCRYTYGIRAFKRFEPGIDPADKRVVRGDLVLCKDFFSKHATIGQVFNTEDKVYSQKYLPSVATDSELEIWVFISTRKHPRYTDEDDCSKVGEFRVKISDLGGDQGAIRIQFEFGKTELEVKIIDAQTNRQINKGSFDMM